ncbi:MAG: hypothetical protein ACT4PV_10710 [Planctomycetaceae bacterium]
MSAWRTFLLDLVTRHLGTKFLSLILSVVLFAFVLQTLSDEREISHLRLRFAIEDELGKRFVVMTPNIDLRKLLIRGIRAKVEDVEQQFKQNRDVDIRISEEFLRRYTTDVTGRNAVRIPINREFFRQLQILRGGVELKDEIAPAPLLELEPRGTVRLRVVPHPDFPQDTLLDSESAYEAPGGGRQVQILFRPESVEISGPAKSLPRTSGAQLKVKIRSVSGILRLRRPEAGKSKVSGIVDQVDWTANDFRGDPALLTVLGLPRSRPEALAQQIEFDFEVQPQRDTRDAVDLPILLLNAPQQLDQDVGFLRRHRAEGVGFSLTMENIRRGVCPLIKISGPKTLMTNEVMSDLQLVIDVANAEPYNEVTLQAAISLRLGNPDSHPDAGAILSFLTVGSPNEERPYVRFTTE